MLPKNCLYSAFKLLRNESKDPKFNSEGRQITTTPFIAQIAELNFIENYTWCIELAVNGQVQHQPLTPWVKE